MLLTKEQLLGYYKWTNESRNNSFKGTPSRRLFDRWNGQQVLYLLNYMGSLDPAFSIKEGQRLEALILNKLPFKTISELSVVKWLNEETMAVKNEVEYAD